MENPWALKYKVQELLDSKAIQFTPENEPNVIQNPMLAHARPIVNVMEEGENLNLIMDVNLMSTLLLCVKGYLVKTMFSRGVSQIVVSARDNPRVVLV